MTAVQIRAFFSASESESSRILKRLLRGLDKSVIVYLLPSQRSHLLFRRIPALAGMSIYVFDQKDVLNSSVRLPSGALVLSTATAISIIHRDYTTLYGADRRPIGSIRWKGRALELQGMTKSTDLIKTKPHFFLDRYAQCTSSSADKIRIDSERL